MIYDVIDGKQRLETILMFMGQGRFKRERFDLQLDLGDGQEWYDWKSIKQDDPRLVAAVNACKIQTVEISGELPQIIDLFVRINSTGKRLTSGEKRHAQFYNSSFLKVAEKLVSKFDRYLRHQRILSPAQIDRMKGVELFSELLMSVQHGGPINKKTWLDRAIGNDSINGNTLHRISNEVARTIRVMRRLFQNSERRGFTTAPSSIPFSCLYGRCKGRSSFLQIGDETKLHSHCFESSRQKSISFAINCGKSDLSAISSDCIKITCSRFRAIRTAAQIERGDGRC